MALVLMLWQTFEGSLIGLDRAATSFTVTIGASIFVVLIMPSTRKYNGYG
ncbi:MAG: hypothetical protein LLG16_09380 [Euryarchaeota archaeon]|nr:hypothetical protein [Euryarchaeota archaeon]